MSAHTRIRPRAGSAEVCVASVANLPNGIAGVDLGRGGCGCSDSTYGEASVLSAANQAGRTPRSDKKELWLARGGHREGASRYWCAAHGSEICDGKKTAEFPTGGVRWRR